jgi:hypothetical protein
LERLKKMIRLLIMAGLVFSLTGCGTFLFERRDDADRFEALWMTGTSKQTMYNPGQKNFASYKQTRVMGFAKGEDVHWFFGKFGRDWIWKVDDKSEIQCCF